jgi:hypothetical protein
MALTIDGNRLFVSSTQANWVTEVNATTGGLLGVISGWNNQLFYPQALSVAEDRLFVANANSSVTEIPVS